MRLIPLAILTATGARLFDCADAGAQNLPTARGRGAVEAVCSSCHSVELIHQTATNRIARVFIEDRGTGE